MYEYFEQLLRERGLTTADVSRATGISPNVFSNWKARRTILSSELLLKISKYFGVHMEYFLGGDFIDWNPETQEIYQTDDYYITDEAKEMAQFLFENPGHRVLFDASRKVKPEDMEKALKAIGLFIDED